MRIAIGVLALAAGAVGPVAAQSEEVLRRYFEGKSVVVKLEMPGSEDGVDVYPGTSMPVNFPNHASRLKRFGTAVRRGEEILVTKVKVKKDLIEFQLGGGGYGTFADETSSHVSTESAPKSQREKNLEKEIPTISDPAAKKKAQEELDALRRERDRADAANRAQVAQAQQVKEANIRQRRSESGSRFNLRYRPVVPPEAMTPDGVMRALAEYVDFTPTLAAAAGRPGLHGEGDRREPAAAAGPDGLRKGMLAEEVDAALGRPESIGNRMEGSLRVSTSVYLTRDRRIEVEFVEGVVIKFSVSSR
jgi:hypothetical protein